MRLTQFRAVLLLVTLAAAVPLFARAIGPDITVPVVGFIDGNGISYRTELVLTNHRDTLQYVSLSFIQDGHDFEFHTFAMEPKETKFLPTAGFATGGGMSSMLGALRIRAKGSSPANDDGVPKLEANAFIVAERGKFGKEGSSRQEVAGIASDEYEAKEAVFLGVRHSLAAGAYTNVGVVNMYAEPVKFFIRFHDQEPTELTVPPFSLRQMRIPGEGGDGRDVRVYPEWSLHENPAHTTPWVAYASTIDIQTGDAYSGMRVPSKSDGVAELTLPVVGYVHAANDVLYRTELVLTNHRDTPQLVRFELISNGGAVAFRTLQLNAGETQYLEDGGSTADFRHKGFLGALRLTAVAEDGGADSLGRIEANAFVVGELALGERGSTRQEVAGIASADYTANEAVFLGTRHSLGTGAYTNVGIVNLHPTQSETFVIEYQYAQPVTIVVPPLSLQQIRIPGEGAGGRWVRVHSDSSALPWVSYASTVDFLTGDAYSGMRVPTDTVFP